MSKDFVRPIDQLMNKVSNGPAQTQTGHQVSAPNPFTALAPPSFPSLSGTSVLVDRRSEGLLTADTSARHLNSKDISNRCRRQLISFDMLPDDILLETFDSYVDEDMGGVFELFKKQRIEEWITLTHVCRRWRSVVFQSPRRLDLRLLCTHNTRTRDILDVWPPLPLIIHDSHDILNRRNGTSGVDDITAALEHNGRVCQIKLRYLTSSQLEYLTDPAAMQKPFPELTDLYLRVFVDDGPGRILPDSFLGGTTPRLRSLYLNNVPFPGLPKLLLSATHLVKLNLYGIPRSGYILPKAMATSLSALTSIEFLRLDFRYPRPRSALGSRRPPPPPFTRSILPSLTEIRFKGVSEYLEEILARIDAPRLNLLRIAFFNQIIFDTPHLFQFISRRPTLTAPGKGHIEFRSNAIAVKFRSQTSDYEELSMEIRCTASEWQLSSLEQVCTSSLPPASALEDLYVSENRDWPPHWQDDVENTLWLDVLSPFVAVRNLYLSEEYVSRIAPALQELVGVRTIEVLPTLENIFMEGFQTSEPLQEGIGKFVAARQLTDRPVTVSSWNRDSK